MFSCISLLKNKTDIKSKSLEAGKTN